MNYSINFPNLHIYLDNVGKNIMIGDFSIAYYGIVIACGMVGAILLATHLAKVTGQDPEQYYDIAIIAIVSGVIGARAYYVFFQWEYYADDLLRIFDIRNGGLGIYGGIIAAVITIFLYTRIKKQSFFAIADVVTPAVALGQCVGRWGNFFNREAFGDYCDGLFAMQLPLSAVRSGDLTDAIREHIVVIDGVSFIQVHPTFLYESMWNLGVLIFLLCYIKHRKFVGEVALLYFLTYGIGRFWIESLRTDQLLTPIFGLPVSMLVAAFMVIVSLTIIIIRRRQIKIQK